MWTVSHTHTQSSGGLPEDLIESRELLLPWQRQLPSSITTRFLSFIVFIPSFFCCPLCFLQMSLCHDAFKVSHNALWNVASGHRSVTLIRQLRGVTLQGVCSVWDSCTETPSAANTSAWRESWVEAGCKAAGNSSWSNLYNPHLQMCWRPPADVGWKKQRRQQHSDPHPRVGVKVRAELQSSCYRKIKWLATFRLTRLFKANSSSLFLECLLHYTRCPGVETTQRISHFILHIGFKRIVQRVRIWK